MANVKISELPGATALNGSEEMVIVQGSQTTKHSIQGVKDLANSRKLQKYVAYVSQGGTANPSAIVMENTTGATVTWSRGETGSFFGSGPFFKENTAVFFAPEFSGPYEALAYSDDMGVVINTMYGLEPQDGFASYIEIITEGLLYTTIGTTKWATKNLDVTTYRNGDPIPLVTDLNVFFGLTSGAYTYVNGDPSNTKDFGLLYNWYAVTDPRNIAPEDWVVPEQSDFFDIINTLGPSSGGMLKDTSAAYWNAPNTGANNSTGFSGRGAGSATDLYDLFKTVAYFWSSTSLSSSIGGGGRLMSGSASLDGAGVDKHYGVSVRLIKI